MPSAARGEARRGEPAAWPPACAQKPAGGKVEIPWRLLLTKPAVWALIVSHFCHNWGARGPCLEGRPCSQRSCTLRSLRLPIGRRLQAGSRWQQAGSRWLSLVWQAEHGWAQGATSALCSCWARLSLPWCAGTFILLTWMPSYYNQVRGRPRPDQLGLAGAAQRCTALRCTAWRAVGLQYCSTASQLGAAHGLCSQPSPPAPLPRPASLIATVRLSAHAHTDLLGLLREPCRRRSAPEYPGNSPEIPPKSLARRCWAWTWPRAASSACCPG